MGSLFGGSSGDDTTPEQRAAGKLTKEKRVENATAFGNNQADALGKDARKLAKRDFGERKASDTQNERTQQRTGSQGGTGVSAGSFGKGEIIALGVPAQDSGLFGVDSKTPVNSKVGGR